MALEPSGGIGNQGEARRMAFRKTIFAEAANLLDYALGECGGDALRLHACDQPFAVALHSSSAMPRRHVAAQLIGFSGSVIRHDHRQPHHLFLEQRHTEGSLENRPQQIMGKIDFLFLLAPAQIRMHHATGDRSGPDNADLDHQVIKILRFEPRQHRHLGAALDLKHADGVALTNHIERRLITLGDRRHRIFDTVMLAQKLETEIELRETAEAEKIDFEESEVLDIDLVPLNHRALRHGGIFYLYHIVYLLVVGDVTPFWF